LTVYLYKNLILVLELIKNWFDVEKKIILDLFRYIDTTSNRQQATGNRQQATGCYYFIYFISA
jgi:hypothetical protein